MNAAEETQEKTSRLKQRLVGMVVLLALAVIFVPLVLDLRRENTTGVITGTNIPAQPRDYRVEVLPLNEPPAPVAPPIAPLGIVEPGVAHQPAPHAPHEPSSGAPPDQAQQQASPRDLSSAPPPHPSREEASRKGAALPPPGTWVIQVGSFGVRKNALALRERLRAKGYPAFVDEVSTRGKRAIRVLVGPELSESRARSVRDQLGRELGIKAIVVSYR